MILSIYCWYQIHYNRVVSFSQRSWIYLINKNLFLIMVKRSKQIIIFDTRIKSFFLNDLLKDEKMKLLWLQKGVSAEKAQCIYFKPFLVAQCDSCRSSCFWNKTLTVCLKRMPFHFRNQTLLQIKIKKASSNLGCACAVHCTQRQANMVSWHCSFKINNSKFDHFTTVFPDSKIVYKFSCGKTNCGYLIAHMLAPHFKQLLLCVVNKLGYFIWLFDESFNRIFMKGQMKLHL